MSINEHSARVARQNIPGDDGYKCLQSPMIDITDHVNVPQQQRSEDISPKDHPKYCWEPEET